MDITIKRLHRSEYSLDGQLEINRQYVCDTAEYVHNTLPSGTYPLHLVKCHQYNRRCLCVGKPSCDKCPLLDNVEANTLMPRVCPMLKIGNGVRGRYDGSILLGELVGRDAVEGQPYAPVWGTLIHSKAAYDTVLERIRKIFERGKPVFLRIL